MMERMTQFLYNDRNALRRTNKKGVWMGMVVNAAGHGNTSMML